MKFSKLSFILVLLVVFACKSDDDSSSGPETVTPNITIDVDAIIALAANSDITDLVNFGQPVGVSSADYTAELNENDTFRLGVPGGLQAGDQLLYYEFDFGPADSIIDLYLEALNCIDEFGEPDPTCQSDFVQSIDIRAFNAEDEEDLEWKYDIICYVKRGDDYFGPYIIDPKIKIKSRNSQ